MNPEENKLPVDDAPEPTNAEPSQQPETRDEPARPASIASGVAGALALSIFRAKTRRR